MLIIFDLDDTLIDTSGTITPFKLKEALNAFTAQEPFFENFFTAYEELLQLNEILGSATDALSTFLLKRSIHKNRGEKVLFELSSPLPKDFILPTTPYAKEILEELKELNNLALVTYGNPSYQREKLEKAGIDPAIFSKIVALEEGEKTPYYKALIEEFSFPLDRVWVCGDRVMRDLWPAHQLGVKTVHVRWGRGRKEKDEEWIDARIGDLRELKGIIG